MTIDWQKVHDVTQRSADEVDAEVKRQGRSEWTPADRKRAEAIRVALLCQGER